MKLEKAMFTSHFRASMGEVMTGTEQLKGLAQTLDGFCDLSAHADADEMRKGVRELIESRFGATVVLRKLASTKVTAATVRAGTAASIVLAASDWQRANNPLLTRVILAHELCHALVDPLVGGLQIVLDESNDRKTNAAEQRARAFAAELLLPLEGLSSLLGPPLSTLDGDAASRMVATARSHFGTTHEIAANHLCNVGFVNSSLRERSSTTRRRFAARRRQRASLRVASRASRCVNTSRRPIATATSPTERPAPSSASTDSRDCRGTHRRCDPR